MKRLVGMISVGRLKLTSCYLLGQSRFQQLLSRNTHVTAKRLLLPRPVYGDIYQKLQPVRKLTVNLLPLWKGQSKQGVRYAPAVILSKIKEFTEEDVDANFIADSTLNSKITPDNFTDTMAEVSKDLKGVEEGELVLNLGGDHAIPMMTIPIMLEKYPDLRVIWIDAHADINSPDTSPSGNFHGMPVYWISEISDPQDESQSPKLSIKNLVYVGVRDVDSEEKRLIEDHNIRNYTAQELRERGVGEVIRDMVARLQLDTKPFHISFDIDALDPCLAPSTGTKVDDGISVEDVSAIFRELKKTGNLVSCDIVEFNPLIGTENDVETTIQSMGQVLREILGSQPKYCRVPNDTQL